MSNFKKLTARECAERLLEMENPTILMHRHPDGDTVGSAAALIKIFAALGKSAQYACADTIPERLEFLLRGSKAAENLEGSTLIAIDVATPDQLGDLKFTSDKVALMIDHHAVGCPFADYYIQPASSGAGETLFDIIDELILMKKLALTPEIAYPLYASISSDTGGFIYSSTTAKTHRRAAALLETEIDFSDINHKLFNSKSESQLRAEGFIATRLTSAINGRVAYATLTKEDRDSLGLAVEHFDTAIDVVRSLQGAEIALFVRENDDGTLRASLRSTGADVASVAAKFSGGGHIRAAGCTPVADSAAAAAKMIIEELKIIL